MASDLGLHCLPMTLLRVFIRMDLSTVIVKSGIALLYIAVVRTKDADRNLNSKVLLKLLCVQQSNPELTIPIFRIIRIPDYRYAHRRRKV